MSRAGTVHTLTDKYGSVDSDGCTWSGYEVGAERAYC